MKGQLESQPNRSGVTLIEVIFSIGVMLVGLVGLVAIIPVAGQQSQDAISATVGSNMALGVMEELQNREYLQKDRIIAVAQTTGDTPPDLTADPATLIPYCFDPMFASSTTIPGTLPTNGYNQAYFPYYNLTHNIFEDPSADTSSGYTPWPVAQPRLRRAGVTLDEDTTVTSTTVHATEISESVDDLIVNRPQDRSIAARLQNGSLQAVSDGLTYGKRIRSGRFSWLATVDPSGTSGYASASVVVVRDRVRLFDVPTATTPPSTADGNATGERIAYVTFGSGFSGGAGGLIHIMANGNTVDDVNVGDWLMMSKLDAAGSPVHRWYRVLSQGGKAERLTLVDGDSDDIEDNLGFHLPTGAGYQVWRRKLLVEGSDWAFGFTSGNYADNTPADNTYVTLVEDVAGVVERVVSLDQL